MRKRTKKKPVGPHLDHDLRKREAKGNRIQNVGRANIKKAKADSKALASRWSALSADAVD